VIRRAAYMAVMGGGSKTWLVFLRVVWWAARGVGARCQAVQGGLCESGKHCSRDQLRSGVKLGGGNGGSFRLGSRSDYWAGCWWDRRWGRSGCVEGVDVTGTMTITSLDMATVADQASNVYGAFTGLLAVLAGVGVGAYVWQRLRGAAQSV
jgi:hypothetical protein